MNIKTTYSRGKARLENLASLPCIDQGGEVKYFGSISKTGDNADWDWGMYQDEKGEWVLAEADGPGCIFNFTQHRYPTSEVPVFRFYFDRNPEPSFEITPAEFGTKPPFLKPLADKFVGPDDNGRGPIWVVRSFVPMEFLSHCKVTSSIKLEGADKALGQGGWGHVIMHLYSSSDGLSVFDPNESCKAILQKYLAPLSLHAEREETVFNGILKSGAQEEIFSETGQAALCDISVKENNYDASVLSDIFIRISFDGKERVCAPFGTFFGCEYGKTPARLDTALLTCDISGNSAFFSNRFPMPYFENVKIILENRGSSDISIAEAAVRLNFSEVYEKGKTGYFTSSPYYFKTANTSGANSVISDIRGCGQMVYGTISGEDIECGCEGDVRIFIDSLSTPSVQSDGSESWGSYGWGFVCPPQCNPFSCYNGVPDSNNTWSETRLTFTDCCYFKSGLRFELEHGCQNDGGGYHSGQIFCYCIPEEKEKFVLEITPDSEYYISDGKICDVTDRFENGIHENYVSFKISTGMSRTEFYADIPADNAGLVLKRVSLQKTGPAAAEVYIDGEKVTERIWLYPDHNEYYSLLEDSFLIPERLTRGKSHIKIQIRSLNYSWNEGRYRIFAISDLQGE